MAKKRTIIEFNGGGALYSQTPESCIGVNVLKEHPPLFSQLQKWAERLPCKGVGTQCLRVLKSNVILNEVKNRKNDMRVNNNHVILSKNCGEKKRSKNLCEGSQKDTSPEFLNSHLFIKKFFPLPQGARETQAAFTLAEVLITLGVVGIIAAMTLPMLARNYQFYIRQQQFKKAYATLEIAVQKTQIDMGENIRCYYKKTLTGATLGVEFTDCQYFWQELMRNIPVAKTCVGDAREKGCIPKDGWRGGADVYAEVQGKDNPEEAKTYYTKNCGGFNISSIDVSGTVYMTSSGFIIMPYGSAHLMGIVAIDINGHKGPNKWGHDIFVFDFSKDRVTNSVFKLNPTDRCHVLEQDGYYTSTFMEYLYGRSSEL